MSANRCDFCGADEAMPHASTCEVLVSRGAPPLTPEGQGERIPVYGCKAGMILRTKRGSHIVEGDAFGILLSYIDTMDAVRAEMRAAEVAAFDRGFAAGVAQSPGANAPSLPEGDYWKGDLSETCPWCLNGPHTEAHVCTVADLKVQIGLRDDEVARHRNEIARMLSRRPAAPPEGLLASCAGMSVAEIIAERDAAIARADKLAAIVKANAAGAVAYAEMEGKLAAHRDENVCGVCGAPWGTRHSETCRNVPAATRRGPIDDPADLNPEPPNATHLDNVRNENGSHR